MLLYRPTNTSGWLSTTYRANRLKQYRFWLLGRRLVVEMLTGTSTIMSFWFFFLIFPAQISGRNLSYVTFGRNTWPYNRGVKPAGDRFVLCEQRQLFKWYILLCKSHNNLGCYLYHWLWFVIPLTVIFVRMTCEPAHSKGCGPLFKKLCIPAL